MSNDCIYCKKIKLYFFGIAYSLDQLLNTVLGGNPDQTVSGRLGLLELEGSKFAKYFCKGLSFVFREENHCINSIEADRMGFQPFYFENEKKAIEDYKKRINDKFDSEDPNQRSRYKTEEDKD